MLGFSLYRYLYLKLAKMLCLSYYPVHFLFNKIRGWNRFCPDVHGGRGAGGEWVAQTMYTRVSKYKNDKTKERKKRIKNA
jgi:hypothetical protein